MVEQRKGGRQHRRRADALQDASSDQDLGAGRHAAGKRRQREERKAAEIDLAGSEAVTKEARGQQERGEHQGVGVDDPLQAGDPGLQARADARQGDVDDGDVELDEREAEARRQRRPMHRRALVHRRGLGGIRLRRHGWSPWISTLPSRRPRGDASAAAETIRPTRAARPPAESPRDRSSRSRHAPARRR